jgi:hypothetical protein
MQIEVAWQIFIKFYTHFLFYLMEIAQSGLFFATRLLLVRHVETAGM